MYKFDLLYKIKKIQQQIHKKFRNSERLIGYGIWIFLILGFFEVVGQDIQYTQYKSSPTYLNPAFTGIFGHQFTVRTHFRKQWFPILEIPINHFNVSFDYSTNNHFTFGSILTQENAGDLSNNLSTTGVAVMTGWRFSTRQIVFQPSIEIGYYTRKLNFGNLTFVDQLLLDDPTAFEAGIEQKNYPSFSTGLVIYSQKAWGGIAFKHLESAFDQNNTGQLLNEFKPSFLWSIHGGINIPFPLYDHHFSFLSSFNYRNQSSTEQLDINTGISYNAAFAMEVGYRGFASILPDQSAINSSSFTMLFSLLNRNIQGYLFNFNYSYDYNFTGLGVKDGSHEISVIMNFSTPSWKRVRINSEDFIKMVCPFGSKTFGDSYMLKANSKNANKNKSQKKWKRKNKNTKRRT